MQAFILVVRLKTKQVKKCVILKIFTDPLIVINKWAELRDKNKECKVILGTAENAADIKRQHPDFKGWKRIKIRWI